MPFGEAGGPGWPWRRPSERVAQIVAEPAQRDRDSWLRCGEIFARIFERLG